MKRIMVTGGTGMVGRNTVEELRRDYDFEVIAPTRKEGDLSRREEARWLISRVQPDILVHAASLVGGIQANIRNPVEFLTENMRIGFNVVQGALETGVERLINIATSCMYPKDQDLLFEDDIFNGRLEPTNEGYAIAKSATARLCQYISKTTDRKYVTLVPGNLYGRYDHFDIETGHLIASVMRRMHEAKENGTQEIAMWGDGSARREFMFVGDLAGFVHLAIRRIEEIPLTINVGLGRDYTVAEYYDLLKQVVEYEGEIIPDLSKPVGMKRKLMDTTLQTRLGWSPPTSLVKGLWETYQYYLDTLKNN